MALFDRDDSTTGTGNPIPSDLLPNFNEVDDIYENLEPDLDWVPPLPIKPGEKPGLPTRTDDGLPPMDVNDTGSSSSHVSDKTVDEVCEILDVLSLSKYKGAFKEHLVDGVLLEECNEKILTECFKFRPIEALRLMKYVREGHVPK